jgi:hypothetical protein
MNSVDFYLKSRDQVKLVKQLGPDHQSVTRYRSTKLHHDL